MQTAPGQNVLVIFLQVLKMGREGIPGLAKNMKAEIDTEYFADRNGGSII